MNMAVKTSNTRARRCAKAPTIKGRRPEARGKERGAGANLHCATLCNGGLRYRVIARGAQMTMQKRFHVSRNIQQDDINNIIVGKTFYHSFRFDNDTYITGWWDVASTADHIGFPPLHGKTILDIGPASGWFSFYFEHCGARVTALEIGNPDEFDNYGFNRYLRNVLQPSDSKVNRRVFNNDAFDVVKEIVGIGG